MFDCADCSLFSPFFFYIFFLVFFTFKCVMTSVRVGDRIGGRYEILGALGSGYFSTIYGALDRFGKTHFAIKIASRAEYNFVLSQEKDNLFLLSREDAIGLLIERKGGGLEEMEDYFSLFFFFYWFRNG